MRFAPKQGCPWGRRFKSCGNPYSTFVIKPDARSNPASVRAALTSSICAAGDAEPQRKLQRRRLALAAETRASSLQQSTVIVT